MKNENKPKITPTKGIDWYRLLPKFWIQNYPTCREWDAVLNTLLDKYEPVNHGSYTCLVGNTVIWVSNYPFAYGSLYDLDENEFPLPMVKTRIRLKRALEVKKANRVRKMYRKILSEDNDFEQRKP